LQGNKPVSGGEGGMLATNDIAVFERACLLGQVNRSPSTVSEAEEEELRYAHLPPMGLGVKFRAHPLAIGIASVQLKKLDELNTNRRAYIQEISTGLREIPGVSPVETYEGTKSAGFFGFPIRYHEEEMHGLPAPVFAEALRKEGVLANNNPYPLLVGNGVPLFSGSLPTNSNPYPLLHTLPLFTHGLDMYMNNRGPLCPVDTGGVFETYTAGDLPVTERTCSQLIFLPLLTKPVAGAASGILSAMRKVSLHSRSINDK
jgi:dTDP-4-amino-4,6-dideoxygalactose transaminase